MNHNGIETERRYLIRMPDTDWLETNASFTDIVQTYLKTGDGGSRSRLRARSDKRGTVYTFTEKRRISDTSREERERELSREEYLAMLPLADPERRRIEKRRYVYIYEGQSFEIDVYPFWQDRAIMELELEGEDAPVYLPPDIELVREVTGDRRYTNASLAKDIPFEPLESRNK